jgi:virginiamycin B lyase
MTRSPGEQGNRFGLGLLRRVSIGLLSILFLSAMAPVNALAAPDGEFTIFDLGKACPSAALSAEISMSSVGSQARSRESTQMAPASTCAFITNGFAANTIAAGPDGNMWFTNNANNSIGVITPKGSVKYFPVPTDASLSMGSGMLGLAAGPDGSMWFTGFYANFIGKITLDGVVTLFPVPVPNAHPESITAGPDGNLWFTLDFANGIGRITPDGIITVFPIPAPGVTGVSTATDCLMCALYITAGPLDSLWFTLPAANLIGRITVDGVITTYPVTTVTPASPQNSTPTITDLTTGADGYIYFTQTLDSKVSNMTLKGVVTDFSLPAGSQPSSITPGPSDTLWFSELAGNSLGSIVVPGAKVAATIKQYRLPAANSVPTAVATGPDGNVWFMNVANVAPNVNSVQVGYVTTGYGRLLSAKVSGNPKVGSTLTCTKTEANTWPAVKTRYHWLRDGQVMAGQDKKTFTPVKKDKGAKISCRVSVTYGVNLNQLGATAKSVSVQG